MNTRRVLIVEDNLIEAYDIQETLMAADFTVTAIARTYDEALQSMRENAPDLVLADIWLEDSSLEDSSREGIALVREIKKQWNVPVLFLTANSELETIERARQTTPFAYLLKPFRRVELVAQLELAYYNHRYPLKSTSTGKEPEELFLPINGGYERVEKADVVYLQAMKSYTGIYMADKTSPHLISMNLGNLSQFFTDPYFHKLSRSALINLNHLLRVERGQVIMKHHSTPISLPEDSRPDLLNKLAIVQTRNTKK